MVIRIKFGESLSCPFQDELRYRMEMGIWRTKMRQAKENGDWDKMDQLDKDYELVGLP